jgi:serine/threonine protein kinase/Tfp pilus assembly protein PilF
MIGKTVLHYNIIEKLGEGGMGVVYKAEDTKLDRTVAIKFLPRSVAANPEERKRFVIEAKAAAALNHPNIATIHAIEESDDEMFIVMEYIEGQELQRIIKSEIPNLESAINYATQIADGLLAAHNKGITHRDIKSSNIMITHEGKIKIMDFGLAKVRGGPQVTKVGTTIGTAAYMSPEQARGDDTDHRSDIWSFGVVLYEMLTGRLPFKGDYEQAIIYSILNENPALDENSHAEIPTELQQIINHALQKNPADRYQHVKDMLIDLKDLAGVSPQSKSRISTRQNIPKTKKSTLLYFGVAAIVVIIIAGYFFIARDKSQEITETTPQRKMIVVLPLENLGPAEDEYFADGLTEEITSRLASVPELGVIARTSAIQYKHTKKTIDQIGEELNVDFLLEGTVRWERTSNGPSRVRVTPQLIRVSDATHLWSDRYDQVIDDIFNVQSQIAEKVIEQLDITLLEPKRQAIQAKPTENFDAYAAYLKGKEYLKFYDESHFNLAIEAFEQAISLDPKFAKAYSQLSQAHSGMVHFGFDKSKERDSKAWESAEKALKLAPDDPDVHIALGYYHYWVHRAYDLAEQEFAIAEKYQPNNAEILAGRAFVVRRQGHWEKSIAHLKKALQLNPLNYVWYADLGFTFTILRKYEEAATYYNEAIKIRSDLSFSYGSKYSNLLLWKGQPQKAVSILAGLAPNDDWSYLTWFLNYVYEKKIRSAIDLMSTMNEEMINQTAFVRPKAFLKGWAYQLDHKPDLAQKAFMSAKSYLESKIEEEPDDFRLYAALGLTCASLGEKERAVRLGKKAVDMYPVSKDALEGPDVALDLTWIYTMVGEQDEALKQLDYLLSIPARISVPLIKIDPRWDALRSNPKYQLLLKKYSSTNG